MGFCKFSAQSIINNKTEVDNIFINDFLPYAPENAVKVLRRKMQLKFISMAFTNVRVPPMTTQLKVFQKF